MDVSRVGGNPWTRAFVPPTPEGPRPPDAVQLAAVPRVPAAGGGRLLPAPAARAPVVDPRRELLLLQLLGLLPARAAVDEARQPRRDGRPAPDHDAGGL